MIGIVEGCKTINSYEKWLTEYRLNYKVVSSAAECLDCKVMIFCGGPDIGTNTERDKLESLVFDECIKKNISILGVCRGMQIVCYLMGADIIEDLGELNTKHKKREDGISNFHTIVLSDGKQWQVNSRHHQAVKTVPFDCSLTGKSVDGIWELLVAADDSKMLVQCHPEMQEMRGTEIEQMCIEFLKRKLK